MNLYQTIRLSLILFLFVGAFSANAQSKRALERAGDLAFQRRDFGTAVLQYAEALRRDENNLRLKWKYAEGARLFYALDIAEKNYLFIAQSKSGLKSFPLTWYRLGECKKMQGDYGAAIDYFERFLADSNVKNAEMAQKAQEEIEQCRWASQQTANPRIAGVKILDKKINSPYSDFAPFVKGDTLFFSSYRFDNYNDKSRPRGRITRLMMSVKGKRAVEVRGNGMPGGDTAHVAHAVFTPEGQHMIFTFCKNRNASDIRCQLWLITRDIRGRWTKPQRLPEPVNNDKYTTTQPNIARDSSGQLRLWFVSDRPGGSGGLDLWSVPLDTNWFCPCNVPVSAHKPMRLPKFDLPQPVAVLNTSGNEVTPFYHRPSHTLYFSSDHWRGFGGYDIFGSRDSAGVFTPPVNAGKEVNTSYNDLYFFLKSDGLSGYLSSNRPGTQYLDETNKACCNDLFEVQFAPPTPPPTFVSKSPEPTDTLPVKINLVPPSPTPAIPPPQPLLSDFIGLPLYFDNDEPDRRTRRTTTLKTYEQTVQAYLERQETYRGRRGEGLPTEKAEQAELEVDNFFENEVRQGYERLDQLCALVAERLQKGESIEIVIKGFTSPRAETDYNLNLGKRRISSVRNHFEAFEDGVMRSFIRSGQLLISETSFGETTARAGISDDLRDERNSIYSPDAARERRVEIVEIKKQ